MDKLTSNFLSQASRHLIAASPSTSAHLSFTNIDLQTSRGLQFDSSVCQSCGTLSIPGRTSSLRKKGSSDGARRKGDSSTLPSTSQVWAARCNACGRDTRLKSSSMKPSSARSRRTVVESAVQSKVPTSTLPERGSDKPSAAQEPKLSSKRRAKARNDRSSLQALLSNTRASSSTPKLSFSDLMKR